MHLYKQFAVTLLLLVAVSFQGCKQDSQSQLITKNDFATTLQTLSADSLEGREVGTPGALKAAGYIASLMEQYGLQGYEASRNRNSMFFQDFNLTRYTVEQLELSVQANGRAVLLAEGTDYEAERLCKNLNLQTQPVFVGYGINALQNGYNDYSGVDVKGKVVVVMNGFPGYQDTTSAGWQAFQNVDKPEHTSLKAKRRTAWEQGAIAIIAVSSDKKIGQTGDGRFPAYEDAEYLTDAELDNPPIPCFTLSGHASQTLLSGTGVDLAELKKTFAQHPEPMKKAPKLKPIRIAIALQAETVMARNVVGILKGKDTSKCVVVAAHYDHLGKRGLYTYNGADDNASGVAGMLAIAKYWAGQSKQPPCNMLFASWTAEEKGMIGSRYFVSRLDNTQQKSILLSMNFDMLSRSEPEDTACRIVTVGRLKGRDDFKEIAIVSNSMLSNPLVLDLWETAGAGGSDYIAFAEKQIPTMSFFSGMHADYHSPADLPDKVDWVKMTDIVNLANGCLKEFMKTVK